MWPSLTPMQTSFCPFLSWICILAQGGPTPESITSPLHCLPTSSPVICLCTPDCLIAAYLLSPNLPWNTIGDAIIQLQRNDAISRQRPVGDSISSRNRLALHRICWLWRRRRSYLPPSFFSAPSYSFLQPLANEAQLVPLKVFGIEMISQRWESSSSFRA